MLYKHISSHLIIDNESYDPIGAIHIVTIFTRSPGHQPPRFCHCATVSFILNVGWLKVHQPAIIPCHVPVFLSTDYSVYASFAQGRHLSQRKPHPEIVQKINRIYLKTTSSCYGLFPTDYR